MQHIDRRRLFKLVGVGTALAAGAAFPVAGQIASQESASQESTSFGFRATLGLPEPPLPSYATYVVEGTVNLATGLGLVTSRMLAGHPGAPSDIGLPGLARIIRVVSVESQAAQVTLRGVIEDRSQLRPGESPQVEIVIDREKRIVKAPFVGRPVVLTIA